MKVEFPIEGHFILLHRQTTCIGNIGLAVRVSPSGRVAEYAGTTLLRLDELDAASKYDFSQPNCQTEKIAIAF